MYDIELEKAGSYHFAHNAETLTEGKKKQKFKLYEEISAIQTFQELFIL